MSDYSAQTPQESFTMRAPAQESNFKRRDDVQLLEQGPHVGILYSMVDLGTSWNEHFKKSQHLIRLTFEFPLFKQLFNEGDTEPKPTVVSIEHTFQIAEKSNLKKFIDGFLGRILQPAEYEKGFDIGQFLGKVMIVNIVNAPSKKDPAKIYNRITTVQGITEHAKKMYAFNWAEVVRTNDLQGFLINPDGSCFRSELFASLPKFIRDKIMESDEAKEYANKGGIFAEQAKRDDTQHATPPPYAPAPAQRTPVAPPQDKLIWLNTDYTYEQMLASGWTLDALIQNGYCKKEVVLPPPPPVPQAPPMPQAPAPAPPMPQMPPQAPAMPQMPPMPQAPHVPQAPQMPPAAPPTGFDAQGNPINFSGDLDGLAF